VCGVGCVRLRYQRGGGSCGGGEREDGVQCWAPIGSWLAGRCCGAAFFEASGKHVAQHVLVITEAFFTHLHVSTRVTIEDARTKGKSSSHMYGIHNLQIS